MPQTSCVLSPTLGRSMNRQPSRPDKSHPGLTRKGTERALTGRISKQYQPRITRILRMGDQTKPSGDASLFWVACPCSSRRPPSRRGGNQTDRSNRTDRSDQTRRPPCAVCRSRIHHPAFIRRIRFIRGEIGFLWGFSSASTCEPQGIAPAVTTVVDPCHEQSQRQWFYAHHDSSLRPARIDQAVRSRWNELRWE
jgi:hypothetical protein